MNPPGQRAAFARGRRLDGDGRSRANTPRGGAGGGVGGLRGVFPWERLSWTDAMDRLWRWGRANARNGGEGGERRVASGIDGVSTGAFDEGRVSRTHATGWQGGAKVAGCFQPRRAAEGQRRRFFRGKRRRGVGSCCAFVRFRSGMNPPGQRAALVRGRRLDGDGRSRANTPRGKEGLASFGAPEGWLFFQRCLRDGSGDESYREQGAERQRRTRTKRRPTRF